jgi:hypothetical protein
VINKKINTPKVNSLTPYQSDLMQQKPKFKNQILEKLQNPLQTYTKPNKSIMEYTIQQPIQL